MASVDTISVTTETDQQLEVDVTSYKADAIWVLVGKGGAQHQMQTGAEPQSTGLCWFRHGAGTHLQAQR